MRDRRSGSDGFSEYLVGFHPLPERRRAAMPMHTSHVPSHWAHGKGTTVVPSPATALSPAWRPPLRLPALAAADIMI